MVKSPKISAVMQKKHVGDVVISLNGKIISVAKDSFAGFKKAKKVLPNIENEEFLISRIHHKYLVA